MISNICKSNGAPIRVVIIDDTATIRRILNHVLSKDPLIRVVGTASDPLEARELIKKTNPDVVTLDVEMPNMNGLEFLRRLMRLRPIPVVMVSTVTNRGSEIALKALELGAVDVFGKPQRAKIDDWLGLVEIVKGAAQAQLSCKSSGNSHFHYPNYAGWNGKIVAIGASTGGVNALETILQKFPKDCPPTMIVQHMSELFLNSFVSRVDAKYKPKIQIAESGVSLTTGQVLIAPGGHHHLSIGKNQQNVELVKANKVSGHRPSVDVLFESLFPHANGVVAVLLTGMGRDGATGLKGLRDRGACTIAQDEASSVVYGMPRAAIEEKAVEKILPLNEIAQAILEKTFKSILLDGEV